MGRSIAWQVGVIVSDSGLCRRVPVIGLRVTSIERHQFPWLVLMILHKSSRFHSGSTNYITEEKSKLSI